MIEENINITERQKIANVMNTKIQNVVCPMCHNKNFAIADGYFHNYLQSNMDGFNFDKPVIPTASIVCLECGFVSQHALGVLNLLPLKGAKIDE